jgi:hypothetical protein
MIHSFSTESWWEKVPQVGCFPPNLDSRGIRQWRAPGGQWGSQFWRCSPWNTQRSGWIIRIKDGPFRARHSEYQAAKKKRKQKDVPNPNHLSIDNVRSSSSRSQISSPLDPIAHHSTIFSSCEIPFLPLISTYFNHDQWVSPVYAQRPLSVATCCWVQSDPT